MTNSYVKLKIKIIMIKKELQFINILKAIAIIFVIITHNNYSANIKGNIFFSYFICMAVPLFMLISGFNYSLSFSNIKDCCLKNYLKSILRKFIRLTLPFLIIFFAECGFNVLNIRNLHFTTALINGGLGPGSYYYPVMVQIILLFPLIYIWIKKYQVKGIIIVFLAQFLFEIICYLTNIKAEVYRILCFRYIFLISLGCYLSVKNDKIKPNILILMEIVGISYINILICSNSAQIYAPFTHWASTSLLTAFYIFPIFAYTFYNHNQDISNGFLKVISDIGRASWHIFLVQMIYFCIIPYSFKYSLKIMLPISLLVNTILGWLFYKIEKQIQAKIKI